MNPINDTTPKLWTLKETAERLRISERTLHNLLNSQQIEGMLIARRWKFTEEAIAAYLEASTPVIGKGARKKRKYVRKQDK